MRSSLVVFALVIISIVLIEARVVLNRDRVHPKYVKLNRADPGHMHEFRIALKQRNLDVLKAKVLDAADPDSVNYGKWWTTEQILDLIAPPMEQVEPVVSWLKSNGVDHYDVSGRDFIKVRASVATIEKIFKTEMHNYRSTETGGVVVRIFGPAHVPDHLSIVDTVLGLTELVPLPTTGGKARIVKERSTEATDPLGFVYPGLLRQMYGIPSSFKVNPKSSLGVVQYFFMNVLNARSYDPQDIPLFNAGMNENTHVDKIVGPFNGKQTAYEPTLDVEIGSALGLNTTFWYWTEMVWMYEFATEFFNSKTYPLVVSMSYGWPEMGQCSIDITGCGEGGSADYTRRTETEFMKISMKGVTLISSSGDQGAPGDNNPFCQSAVLSDMYPASSIWVTSVGATMLTAGGATVPVKQPPVCQQQQCATTGLETTCSFPTSLITTGGGFSTLHPVQSWQQTAVNQYLNSGVSLPTGLFNQSNRGFPDISANGHNYLVSFSPYGFIQMDGTSASTPLLAGMVSLLNSYMLNHNKTSLGFLNPLLYKMAAEDPSTFTDITTGNNKCTMNCCSSYGFSATNGWDPATGLGTPVYPKIENYLKTKVINKKL